MTMKTIAVAALSTAVGMTVLEVSDAISAFRRPTPPPATRPIVPAGFAAAEVDRVLQTDEGPVVLVRREGEARALPIWIGDAEGRAIARALYGMEVARPMTHDLLADTIEGLEAEVHHVRVERLTADGVYIGAVALATAKGPVTLDARPSDALALALRTGAAIYLSQTLAPHLLDLGAQD